MKPLHALALGVALLTATAAPFLWLRSRPVMDDAEMDAWQRRVAQANFEASQQRCERPVLRGSGLAEDGTMRFRELLSETGPFGTCINAAMRDDSTRATSEERVDEEEQGANPFEAPAFVPVRASATAEELAILAACDGLTEAVHDVVSHASVCSPFGLDVPPQRTRAVHMMRGLVELARNDIREHHTADAVVLLLDGLRLAQDFARGRTTVLDAMVSSRALISMLTVELAHALLDPSLTEQELLQAERELAVLAQSAPDAVAWLRDDGFAMMNAVSDASVITDERAFAARQRALNFAELSCEGIATREACFSRFLSGEIGAGATASPWASFLGRRAEFAASVARDESEARTSLATYWYATLVGEARLRALSWVVRLRVHELRTGHCPDEHTVPSPAPLDADFGGVFRVVRGVDGTLQINLPLWLTNAPIARPLGPEVALARVPCTASESRPPRQVD